MDDETVGVEADQEEVDDDNNNQSDKPILGEEVANPVGSEEESTDVTDDETGVEEGVAENGSGEDQVGVIETDDLNCIGNVECVRRENDDEHVDTEEDCHQLPENVDVENLDIEIPNSVLCKCKDVVDTADNHDDVEDEERDPNIVEEEYISGKAAGGVLLDEEHGECEQDDISYQLCPSQYTGCPDSVPQHHLLLTASHWSLLTSLRHPVPV